MVVEGKVRHAPVEALLRVGPLAAQVVELVVVLVSLLEKVVDVVRVVAVRCLEGRKDEMLREGERERNKK